MTGRQPKMSVIALVAKDLTKSYGDNIVLKTISFELTKGEFVVVVGPSPCGKTVLLDCIMGLEKPTSGHIYMNGKDITGVHARSRDVCIVFQDLALFAHMNVFDNVSFGLRMMGYPKDRIEKEVNEVLRLVRLEGLGDRRITELSGGQKQRVALARSLVLKPSILLFDEPIANLDLKLRQRMLGEIKDLHRRLGFTALYVTHDQEQAMRLADRIMVMNQGSIEQIGTPEEVYLNPATLFVAKFVGGLNMLDGEVASLKDDLLMVRTGAGDLAVNDRRKIGAKVKRVIYCIRPEKVSIGEQARNLDNTVEGKLVDQTYKGSSIERVVHLKNGVAFRSVSEGRDLVDLGSYIGRDVVIGWKSNDSLVFPA